jgi:hypothetical protein
MADADAIKIRCLWQMKDGDYLTITNRTQDMPGYFSLHPTEVCNSLAYRVLEQYNKTKLPARPISAPMLLRPKTADRLLQARLLSTESPWGCDFVAALALRNSALVVGETVRTRSLEEMSTYGSLADPHNMDIVNAVGMAAKNYVVKMGDPREFDEEWKIG